MAISFTNTPPKWDNGGTEPTSDKKIAGYEVNDTLPADYLNWFWSATGKCIEELQAKLNNENINREQAVTEIRNTITAINALINGLSASDVGLDKVDNTPDSEKHVAFASEAGIGRKVANELLIRLKGGSTEGVDLWTYNGSTSKSVNITPEKIGGAKDDLSNVDDDVFKEKVESTVQTGTPLVTATSTDGETYTATVDGITELYNGLEITIIPNMTSTKAAVKVDLNGLGAKNLRTKIDGYNSGNSGTLAAFDKWVGENVPLTIRYISKFDNWQTVDFSRPSASGLYGTIKLAQGGTGITEVMPDAFLVGGQDDDYNPIYKMKTAGEVADIIGVPKIVYGSYIGDDTVNRIIDLGFAPKCVIIECADTEYTGCHGAVVINGYPVVHDDNQTIVEIIENGFKIYSNALGGYNTSPYRYNYVVIY